MYLIIIKNKNIKIKYKFYKFKICTSVRALRKICKRKNKRWINMVRYFEKLQKISHLWEYFRVRREPLNFNNKYTIAYKIINNDNASKRIK